MNRKKIFGKKSKRPKKLYDYLMQDKFTHSPYQMDNDQNAITILQQSINGWWKPRYIVDHEYHEAYEFMDEREQLLTIADNDIDWGTLQGLPTHIVTRAKIRDGHFPVLFGRFRDGKAKVTWEINPDGRYYMDEDGYGMTDDEEIELVGTVDRTGKVISKFRYDR